VKGINGGRGHGRHQKPEAYQTRLSRKSGGVVKVLFHKTEPMEEDQNDCELTVSNNEIAIPGDIYIETTETMGLSLVDNI
jgi:two-component sensor histidine kinase